MTPPPRNLHRAGGNRHGKRFSPSSQEDEVGRGRQRPQVLCGAEGITMLGRGGSCRGSASGVGRAGQDEAGEAGKLRQTCQ